MNFSCFDSNVSGDIRGGSGTDSLNLPVGTIVNDASFGTFTVTVGGSSNLSSGSFTLPSGKTIPYSTFENGVGIPCLAEGTLIETTDGPVLIQDLKVGDGIRTTGDRQQKIRWIGNRALPQNALVANPKLRPVVAFFGLPDQQC